MKTTSRFLITCLALGLATPAVLAKGPGNGRQQRGPRWEQQPLEAGNQGSGQQTRERKRAKDGSCRDGDCDKDCGDGCKGKGKGKGRGQGQGRGRGQGQGQGGGNR